MYLLIGILFALCVLFYVMNHCRKRHIIRKICCMSDAEKCCLLNELAQPFGFEYLPDQDIFTSTYDSWQKEFGYCAAFDDAAVHFNMVFDCEPVYFDYNDRTWLIEFWKGQYGINTGAEIGVYRANSLLLPSQYSTALFHGVPSEEMLGLRMELQRKNQKLFSIERIHWWLTGFRMGAYSEPEDLELQAVITFPNEEMLQRFAEAVHRKGCHEVQTCGCRCSLTASFAFDASCKPCHDGKKNRLFHCLIAWKNRMLRRFAQWKNRIFCRLFLWITRPFTCTPDRMLYLYYFLPFAFRRMLKPRKYYKHRKSASRRYS
ncbi:MAG: DUF4474 domain-containing protein [Lachnospiraceae bacterium]|jgi:hypothetical protein|nr:DUF4474 domain-containing protein [Lachnospiraceae bacterium]